jgi:hypothetical protein
LLGKKPGAAPQRFESLAIALMACGLLILICSAIFFWEKIPISLLALGIGLALAGNFLAPDPAISGKSQEPASID